MIQSDGEPEEMPKKSRDTRKPEMEQAEVAAQAPTYEEICERAYQIHIERGREHGRDVDDWLQAERELMQNDR
jgi:hypothetical protein